MDNQLCQMTAIETWMIETIRPSSSCWKVWDGAAWHIRAINPIELPDAGKAKDKLKPKLRVLWKVHLTFSRDPSWKIKPPEILYTNDVKLNFLYSNENKEGLSVRYTTENSG